MGRSAKRFRKWEKKQHNKPKDHMETDDEEINAAWLTKEGLDMNVIEAAMNKEPDTVSEELKRNSELLEELLSYQKTRFSGGESNWASVEEKEVEIGKSFFIKL
jgi:IS30 family transposase